MAQATVVATSPRVELAICGDGGAVRAAAGHVHHLLSRLLPVESGDHGGLFQIPGDMR